MKICILGSGSKGNCVYAASENVAILIDAGLSFRETARRLAEIGVDFGEINAVCVTHEHSDHKASLGVLHRRCGVDLYANTGTVDAVIRDPKCRDLTWNVFETGQPFSIGDMVLEPFSVPHDSYDPVGFVLSHGGVRVGIVTDMGMTTALIRDRLQGCHAVVIESNHDEDLLRESSRPWSLKQRISGRQGHLSNGQAGLLAADIAGPELEVIFLAHLSADCNRPELAKDAVEKVLSERKIVGVRVELTYPGRVSAVWERST